MESKVKLLGHPIHPMLIPFPLGLLGMAVIFDVIDAVADQPELAQAAYYMIAAGILSGLLAAVFGAIDWAAIPEGTRAKRIASTHGLGNVVVLVVFAIAWLTRRDEPHDAAATSLILELIGLTGAMATGWLGGELVDRLGVGVDHGAHLNAPNSFSGQPASQSKADKPRVS